MSKFIFAALIAASVGAKAAPTISGDDLPRATISTDETRTFIYVKTPVHWLFDDNQKSDLVQKLDKMMQSRLQKLKQVNLDDQDGDLQTLQNSMQELRNQVDLLVKTAGQVNGQLKKSGLYAIDPTGLIVFAGVELQENFAKVLYAGGSFMLGLSIVPMQVETYRADTRVKVGTSWDYDVSFVAIPTANVGVGMNPGASVKGNKRGGIGLVFNTLNSASEVVGLAFGPSATGQVSLLGREAGLNVKFVGLKNFSKPGMINNEMLLIGVEQPNAAAANNVSLFGWDVEAHIGISPILDPTPLLKKIWDMAQLKP